MWGNSLLIARIFGIEIRLDASWLLIAALIVASLGTGYFSVELAGTPPTTLLLISVVAMIGLFASLVVHELAHATVARRYGIQISGITLFFFGGVAEIRNEPPTGISEFWIAIAGPATSFALALMLWLTEAIAQGLAAPLPILSILTYLATLNLVLGLFNLMPAFPMDGGRMLRAWLWIRSKDILGATRRAVAVSNAIAIGLLTLGIFALFSGAIVMGLWPSLIGLFLLATSRTALAQLETETAFRGRTVADVMTRNPITANVDQTLAELVNRVFLEHAVTFAPVVQDGCLLGYVDTRIVRKIDREHWATTTVDDVIEPTGPHNTIEQSMSGLDLLATMSKTGRRKFMVVSSGRFVGVITLSDILALLNVARQVGFVPQRD